MAEYGFVRDIANGELDIQVAGTVALTLSTTDLSLPVSTITYGGRGTATQPTDHTGNVTINATSGTITLDDTDLAGGDEAQFDVANSFVEVGDVVVVNLQTKADAEGTHVVGIAEVNAGSFTILLINPHATEAGFSNSTTLNFAVIKTAA